MAWRRSTPAASARHASRSHLALARTDDDALTGSIEASLAYVEAETGDRAEAMRLCETRTGRGPD